MKKLIISFILFFNILASSAFSESVLLFCAVEKSFIKNQDPFIVEINYKERKIKLNANDSWNNMFFDKDNIFFTGANKTDDLGTFIFLKKINRFSGKFIFYSNFLNETEYKKLLSDTYKIVKEKGLKVKDPETIKILGEEIMLISNPKREIVYQCSKKDEVKQKF